MTRNCHFIVEYGREKLKQSTFFCQNYELGDLMDLELLENIALVVIDGFVAAVAECSNFPGCFSFNKAVDNLFFGSG